MSLLEDEKQRGILGNVVRVEMNMAIARFLAHATHAASGSTIKLAYSMITYRHLFHVLPAAPSNAFSMILVM